MESDQISRIVDLLVQLFRELIYYLIDLFS